MSLPFESEAEPSPEDIAAAQPTRIAKGAFRGDPNGNGNFSPAPIRMLPSSIEAEQGVLCSILLSPADIIALCHEKKLGPDLFHVPAHAILFGVLMEMSDAGKVIDLVTLCQRIFDLGHLDKCGGMAFVSQLYTYLPTAAHAENYIAILREKWTLREHIRMGTAIVTRAYDRQDDVPVLLDEAEKDVLSIRARLTENRITTARVAVMDAMDDLQQQFDRQGQMVGLPSGFPDLDALTGGFRDADLIIIAARPSQGKTAIAMNMAEYVAVDCGHPVGIFSVEMSTRALMQRFLSARGRVNLVRWRQGDHHVNDADGLARAAQELGGASIAIDDTSAISIQELRGKARIMRARYGIRALFVDYLQLVTSSSRRAQQSPQQELTEVSGGLKALAKELSIPVIALAQLNRDFEKRGGDERPRLSDLRGSGSIEQDADIVAFIVREEFLAKDEKQKRELAGKATLTIAKQRSGPLGDVYLTFRKEIVKFEPRDSGEEPQGELPL